MGKKQSIFWMVVKQLLGIILKLFLILLLATGRIIVTVVSLMNEWIESYLKLNIKKKKLN